MHSSQLIEAVIAKTNLMIRTAEASERPHVIARRVQELAGMIELARWSEQSELEYDLERHAAQLEDQLHDEYRGMGIVTIATPAEFMRLCERHQAKPDVVLRGFIADLCGIINWVKEPRPDGYASHGSDERRLADEYYERVGYPYFNQQS